MCEGVVKNFERASGQRVSLEKSSVFFSKNVDQSNKHVILSRLGMQEANMDSKYLGLPSTLSRNKTTVFGYLKE